jgi:hypothetical protein
MQQPPAVEESVSISEPGWGRLGGEGEGGVVGGGGLELSSVRTQHSSRRECGVHIQSVPATCDPHTCR